MNLLSIVIPIYKSEGCLDNLMPRLQKVHEKLSTSGITTELIFIDDCSPDGSWEKLLSLKEKLPDIKLIKHWSNQGVVGAIKSGLLEANGDIFTILAPDLQDPPELLIELTSLCKSGHKMAIAVRESRNDPALSKIFSKLYYMLLRLVVCHDYPKGGFDLGVWDKAYIKPILSCKGNKNISLFTWSLGVPAATINYHRCERSSGKSSWSFYKKLHYFMDSFVGMSAKPLRIACAFAFLISLFTLTGAVGIVGWNILFYSEIPKIAVFASAILILFSAIFTIFGLLGEYIWRLYESTTIYKEGLKTTILR